MKSCPILLHELELGTCGVFFLLSMKRGWHILVRIWGICGKEIYLLNIRRKTTEHKCELKALHL
jgi:hypothetical protein